MVQAKRSPVARFFSFLIRCLLWYLALTFALVLVYRFVPVPTTLTMLFDSNGAERDWEPLSNISPNLVRAVIAAEDAKFCQHNGFDTEALEKARWINH
jgi:monofunctional biosynthetic peptidoglycan transglycosylase